ncbi:MAG: VOC family protein [Candidatus Binataceae bacterium]|nr:VOC family protein [Candidatus Binataceae bacterium]
MPRITDRSINKPVLDITRLGHGTLECVDIAKTRRFYEEVLGLDVVQTSPISLLIRKGYDHTYAVVETGKVANEQDLMNHNGLEVIGDAAVDSSYERLLQIKDEYGIRKLQRPHKQHGNYAFYFMDLDGNWWEIVSVGPGGYADAFTDKSYDLTGRHDLNLSRSSHMNDPQVRARTSGNG